jgi:putative chitinase
MTIVYTIDDNTNQDTTSTKNSFNGANYTDKNDGNPTLDGNSDCTVGTPDSSWTSNLEMSDTKINGEEVKFDGNYIVTEAQLKKIMSQASNSNIKKFIIPLNVAMKKFGITAPLQVSAFLSQIALESGNLLYTKELGGPSYFKRYDGRKDLGNTKLGDGAKYCGRGLIQVTGKSNYADLSKNLGADFVTSPEMLESPTWASISAAYWWFKNQNKKTKKMRANLAGCIATKDIQGITYAVNGGQNGISERTKYYKNALSILGLA